MGMDKQTVHVVGGGLAGSEAAWQLARAGVLRACRRRNRRFMRKRPRRIAARAL
jgi:folate-dependent tRNA-U54 methylase TrmFO/GidA